MLLLFIGFPAAVAIGVGLLLYLDRRSRKRTSGLYGGRS